MARQLNRILVAVDDSDTAADAVDEGIVLAAAAGAELVLAHVVTILGEPFAPGAGRPARVPDADATAPLARAAERADAAGIARTTELLVGRPAKQLALLADDLDVDLIVVGSRHLKGARRVLLGSTSRDLLERSTRPVLVVPHALVDAAVNAA